MIARRIALVALIPMIAVMTGCGRTAGAEVEIEETAVPRMATTKTNAPKVVYVDGRAYTEDKAPKPFTAPEAAAPEAGKGNLRAIITTATMGDSTFAVSFHVNKGDENVHAAMWEKADLGASAVASIAANLEPGEYSLMMNRYNKAMGLFAQKVGKVVVEADKTVDVKF